LKCNGAAISRATYADLFTVIGTTFGVGNGSTTFNIPDLRGEFVRGWDNSRGIDSGRVFGSSQADALQNITGSFYSGSYTATTTGAFSDASGGSRPDGSNETARKITFDASTVARTSTETRPRNIALLACIRY
jgi:microcystin-dependent protein